MAAEKLTPKRIDIYKKYYVYFLIDPRDENIFYIGKGTGSRIKSHVAEYYRGGSVNKIKTNRIGEIINAGFKVKEVIFRNSLNESEAFKLEKRLISKFKDSGLTNISSGSISPKDNALAKIKDLKNRLIPYNVWAKNIENRREKSCVNVFGSVYNAYWKIANEIDKTIFSLETQEC